MVARTQEIQELLFGDPFAPYNDLLPKQRDMRRRTAERDPAKLQKEGRNL